MKEQQFDQLFRDKLKDYAGHVPPTAADRFRVVMFKRKQAAWIQFGRFAAVVTLIAASVLVMTKLSQDADEKLSMVHQPKPSINNRESESLPDMNITERRLPPVTKKAGKIPETTERTSEVSTYLLKAPQEAVTAKSGQVKVTYQKSGPTKQQLQVYSELENTEPDLADISEYDSMAVNNQAPLPRVTITYKRSPKPPDPRLALKTQTERRAGVIQKLWVKAQNIQLDDLSLAGIRGTKDEILDIELKSKNKTEKSN